MKASQNQKNLTKNFSKIIANPKITIGYQLYMNRFYTCIFECDNTIVSTVDFNTYCNQHQ